MGTDAAQVGDASAGAVNIKILGRKVRARRQLGVCRLSPDCAGCLVRHGDKVRVVLYPVVGAARHRHAKKLRFKRDALLAFFIVFMTTSDK